MPFTHILIPTDFSTPAHEAVDVALQEAGLHQARLTLVHVLHHHPNTEVTYMHGNPADRRGYASEVGSLLPQPSGREPPVVRRDYVEEAFTQLRDLVPQSCTASWNVEVARGDPASAIVRMAEEQGVDLIVMASHGRTGMAHALLGSVAEKVMRHAPCPVLVTRAYSATS